MPSSAPADDDGSGTDTDEDGELIAKARQKALLERQRAAVAKKRGPGTGDLPPVVDLPVEFVSSPTGRSQTPIVLKLQHLKLGQSGVMRCYCAARIS